MEIFFLYIFPLSSNHDEGYLHVSVLFPSFSQFLFFFQHENSSCFELLCLRVALVRRTRLVQRLQRRQRTDGKLLLLEISISSNSSTVGYLRCVQSIGFASITNPKQDRITNCKTFQEKPAIHNASTISRGLFCIVCRRQITNLREQKQFFMYFIKVCLEQYG